MTLRGHLRTRRTGFFRSCVVAGMAFLFASASSWSEPSPLLTFRATPESRVTINGLASIGRWECESSEVDAEITPGPEIVAFALGSRTAAFAPEKPVAPATSIVIPVASLRCDKPGMRADLLHALRYKTAPRITFQLACVESIERAQSPSTWPSYRVIAAGTLHLAGETRPLRIAADVTQESATRFRVTAKETIRMSDFAITPPSAFFGLIQAGDAVEIAFDLRFGLVADARE